MFDNETQTKFLDAARELIASEPGGIHLHFTNYDDVPHDVADAIIDMGEATTWDGWEDDNWEWLDDNAVEKAREIMADVARKWETDGIIDDAEEIAEDYDLRSEVVGMLNAADKSDPFHEIVARTTYRPYVRVDLSTFIGSWVNTGEAADLIDAFDLSALPAEHMTAAAEECAANIGADLDNGTVFGEWVAYLFGSLTLDAETLEALRGESVTITGGALLIMDVSNGRGHAADLPEDFTLTVARDAVHSDNGAPGWSWGEDVCGLVPGCYPLTLTDGGPLPLGCEGDAGAHSDDRVRVNGCTLCGKHAQTRQRVADARNAERHGYAR